MARAATLGAGADEGWLATDGAEADSNRADGARGVEAAGWESDEIGVGAGPALRGLAGPGDP